MQRIRFGPVWYAASHLHEKNLAAVFTSLAVAGVLLARRFWPNPSNLIVLIFNLVLPILLSLTILPFFYAVGPTVIANNRATFDEYLVAIDTALWGWYVILQGLNSLFLLAPLPSCHLKSRNGDSRPI